MKERVRNKAGVEEITSASIKRMARRGGVKRVSDSTYDETRTIIKVFLEDCLVKTVVFTRQRDAKTINLDDLKNAEESSGHHIAYAGKSRHHKAGKQAEGKVHQEKIKNYGSDHKPRTTDRKFHPGVVAEREIKYYQSSDDLLMTHEPFVRVARAISRDYGEFRFTGEVLYVLQEMVESYIVGLFKDAALNIKVADRMTVEGKDLQLIRRLRGERH